MRNAFDHLILILVRAGLRAEVAPLVIWLVLGIAALSVFLVYLYRSQTGKLNEFLPLDKFLLSWRWVALTFGSLFLCKAILAGIGILGFPIADTREIFFDVICIASVCLLILAVRRSRQAPAQSSIFGDFLHVGRYWFATFAVLLLIRSVVAAPWRIVGESITPEISDGQYVLGNRLRWGIHLPIVGRVVSFKPAQRDELIVFRDPIEPDRIRFGKVIGLTGEPLPALATENQTDAGVEPVAAQRDTAIPTNSVLVATDPSMTEKPFVIAERNIYATVAFVFDIRSLFNRNSR